MRAICASVLVAASLAAVGCARESVAGGDGSVFGDGQIRYRVSVSGSGVRSSVPSSEAGVSQLTSADGSYVIPMSCEVSDGIGLCGEYALVRGALINTSGSAQALPSDNTFTVSAYDVTTGIQSFSGTASQSGAYWTMDTPRYWKLDDKLKFFAYANAGSNSVVVNGDATLQTLTYTVGPSAENHQDILLGYGEGDGRADGVVELHFGHPLTAVMFKQGNMPGVTGIKSITLSGLASGGTVTMTKDGIGGWNVTSYSASSVLGDGTSALEIDGTSKVIGKDNGAFLLVPQNLAASGGHPVMVTVVLTTAYGDVTVCDDITSGEWEAGKTNTYTLGYVVPVESITLDKTSTSVLVGGTQILTATVLPDYASEKGVTWSSDANGIATVDENGVVTGVSKGTCTITATAKDGSGKSATCTVTVMELKGIKVSDTQYVQFAPGNLWFFWVSESTNPMYEGNIYNFYKGMWFFEEKQTGGYIPDPSVWPVDRTHLSWFSYHGAGSNYGSNLGYQISEMTQTTTVDWGNTEFMTQYDGTSTPANLGTGWRTMTIDEWVYVLKNHEIRWKTINDGEVGVPGVCIYQQGYAEAVGTYDEGTVEDLENHGVIFLPAAGFRDASSDGNGILGSAGDGYGITCRYWSSTRTSNTMAQNIYLQPGNGKTATTDASQTQFIRGSGAESVLVTTYPPGNSLYAASTVRLVKNIAAPEE